MFTQKEVYDSICPSCKSRLNSVSHEDDILPEEGDITICFICGEILKFGHNLTLSYLSDEDVLRLVKTDYWIDIRRKQDEVFETIRMGNGH